MTNAPTTSPRPTDAAPSNKRNGFVLTALSITLLLVIVAGAWWALTTPDTATPGGSSVPPTSGMTALPADTSRGHAGFGPMTSDIFGTPLQRPIDPMGQLLPQTSPSSGDWSAAPQGLVWENIGGFPIPFSSSDGPTGFTADGVPTGFSRTPQGAVLAALQAGRIFSGLPVDQRWAVAHAMYALPTDAIRRLIEGIARQQRTDADAHSTSGVPAAVKVTSFDGTHIQFHVAGRVSPTQYVDSVADMVWQDGHWLVVPPDSRLPQQDRTIAALDASWVRWS